MGLGGRMYKYLTDVQFIKKLTHEGTKLTQALGHQLKIDYDIGTYIMLVGSAKRKMITQNEKGDVDMDYNLVVIKSPINNGKDLKEAVRKSFNKVLKRYGYEDCQDSTSSLSTKLKSFNQYNQTKYKFDIAIVKEDKQGYWQRLIHCKTGSIQSDTWFWNQTPDSRDIKRKETYIKNNSDWQLVREKYLTYKNNNLVFDNNNLHSFTCYERAVNDVYNQLQLSSLVNHSRV